MDKQSRRALLKGLGTAAEFIPVAGPFIGGALKVAGSFKSGGKVKKTGIYKLHKGETVLTPAQFRKHKLGHRNG